jgi:hypothetical protein
MERTDFFALTVEPVIAAAKFGSEFRREGRSQDEGARNLKRAFGKT